MRSLYSSCPASRRKQSAFLWASVGPSGGRQAGGCPGCGMLPAPSAHPDDRASFLPRPPCVDNPPATPVRLPATRFRARRAGRAPALTPHSPPESLQQRAIADFAALIPARHPWGSESALLRKSKCRQKISLPLIAFARVSRPDRQPECRLPVRKFCAVRRGRLPACRQQSLGQTGLCRRRLLLRNFLPCPPESLPFGSLRLRSFEMIFVNHHADRAPAAIFKATHHRTAAVNLN